MLTIGDPSIHRREGQGAKRGGAYSIKIIVWLWIVAIDTCKQALEAKSLSASALISLH